VEGGLYLLEALQVPEEMRCVLGTRYAVAGLQISIAAVFSLWSTTSERDTNLALQILNQTRQKPEVFDSGSIRI
jgi:hypothetical protein